MKKWIYSTLGHMGTVTTEIDGDDIELEPDTELYVASEVDARIAEMEKSHQRYEKLRRLSPREFHSLWMENISQGTAFDELVDRLSS
jgi:hypothetical protein